MSKSTWQDALVHDKETKPKPLLLPKNEQQLVRDGIYIEVVTFKLIERVFR